MIVRSREQRKHDVLGLLESEIDAWVSSVSEDGSPYLVPLSFLWNNDVIVLATPAESKTARNFRRESAARMAVGPTRDVVMIDGHVEFAGVRTKPALAEKHASKAGFDARTASEPFVFLLVYPQRIQAWRNPEELSERVLMSGGIWLV